MFMTEVLRKRGQGLYPLASWTRTWMCRYSCCFRLDALGISSDHRQRQKGLREILPRVSDSSGPRVVRYSDSEELVQIYDPLCVTQAPGDVILPCQKVHIAHSVR